MGTAKGKAEGERDYIISAHALVGRMLSLGQGTPQTPCHAKV